MVAKRIKIKVKAKKKPINSRQTKSKSPRRLKQPRYRTLRLSKRIKHPNAKLPSALKLLAHSLGIIKQNPKIFLRITVLYGLLTIILVRGVAGEFNLNELKSLINEGLEGQVNSLTTGVTLFSYLLGSAGSSSSPTGGVYQTFLIIIMSLAVIWGLRQALTGASFKIRDTFYKGMYPLIPFILVLLVIGLQLIPLLIGSWLYGTVISSGIAVTFIEKIIWGSLFFLLALLSIYMVCSSLFALYIVTLPDMTPMKALRSARQLVLHRRWTVIRKVLFLPFVMLLLAAVIMIPLIILVTGLAEWIFFLLTMFIVVVIHSYMYTLYRELL